LSLMNSIQSFKCFSISLSDKHCNKNVFCHWNVWTQNEKYYIRQIGSKARIKQAKLAFIGVPPISPINDIDNRIAYQNHFSNRQSRTHILFLFSKPQAMNSFENRNKKCDMLTLMPRKSRSAKISCY